MKNIKTILIITLLVIGIALTIWCAIAYDQYPGMKEMRKAAFQSVKYQEIIGITSLVVAYILTYVKKKF
jgi:hypothetical protein